MSDQTRKKQTFRLIIGAGLELSYSPQQGVKLRLLKPGFTSTLGAPALLQPSSPVKAPAQLPSKGPHKKGSIIDIYC